MAKLSQPLHGRTVIDLATLSGKDVKFGATVALLDLDTDKEVVWRIVGDLEADASDGRIGIASPLARALIGRKQGDFVEVATPRGSKEYEVKKVSFKPLRSS